MTFKKSALTVALMTMAGTTAMATVVETPLTRTNYDNQLGDLYQQTAGTLTVNNEVNNSTVDRVAETLNSQVILNATTKVKIPAEPTDTFNKYEYKETRAGELQAFHHQLDTNLTDTTIQDSRRVEESSFSNKNGLVTRTAQTQINLDADGNEILGTETRLDDVDLTFTQYDFTKDAGAFERSYSEKTSEIQYKPDQVKNLEFHGELTSLNRYNDIQYDANGQPVVVNGQAAYVELKNQNTIREDVVVYNADDVDDSPDNIVLKSRDASGRLVVASGEQIAADKEANYLYDHNGDFVTHQVDAYGNVNVSNITESNLAQSLNYTDYDDVSTKDLELSLQGSTSYQQTDIFDNFVSYYKHNEKSDLTVYNDGQSDLAWEGQLSQDASWKSREVSEKNGQLNIDSITTGTSELNQQDAYYQPTHNAEGENYNIQKATGNQSIPFPSDYLGGNGPMLLGSVHSVGDTALQSSLYDSKFHEKTVDGSGNLVREVTKNEYESLNYAANMQENIEVDRDLVRSSLRDKTVVGSKVVFSTNPQDQVVSGFTRKFDGSPITLNDVDQWVDDNGNTHHYVVLGLDKNGQEIRTEVQITDAADPTSLSLNATYNQLNTSNSTESVRYNEDEFYKSTDSSVNSYTTTYEDGSVEYDKSTSDQTITVYNENVTDKEWEGTRAGTQANQDVTFADVGGVATAAQINTSASSFAEKTTKYKAGQVLEEETTRTFTNEGGEQDLLANTTSAYQGNWERNEKLYAEGASDLKRVTTESSAGTSSYTSATQTVESERASNNQKTIYQAGDIRRTETGSESQSTTTKDVATGNSLTYATQDKSASTKFNTETGLLATQDVLSTKSRESQESLSITEAGVTTSKTVVRGSETEKRSDRSSTKTVYGSQTNVAGDGSQTVLAKSATTVVDKFGIEESNQLTQANTNITAAGAATTTTQQRTDDVSGIKLEKTVTLEGASTQRVAGTTQTSSTIISAGEISVDGVSITANGLNANNTVVSNVANGVADSDAANLGQVRSYYNDVSGRVNQLNTRVDDVEKTSYRGIAIALAAQQQIPNIGAGQFAVFGGVGHYEGESAGALGLASVFADGRTSVSAAVGFAGGNEVGGRVGVSYVFGGK
ncbi:YadA-like family protein [Acinetobacter sp. SM34]|uniref:YadA-like family protein n=1 Tax=Acinetobacter sp. SM34 TaxID=1301620 RepID=UPI001ED9F40D|nr:YadA-like family protein [Acinetobacter sp. SM34]MCG2607731.1 YadA-like family protein [Acinetobacter sp. SM34]